MAEVSKPDTSPQVFKIESDAAASWLKLVVKLEDTSRNVTCGKHVRLHFSSLGTIAALESTKYSFVNSFPTGQPEAWQHVLLVVHPELHPLILVVEVVLKTGIWVRQP